MTLWSFRYDGDPRPRRVAEGHRQLDLVAEADDGRPPLSAHVRVGRDDLATILHDLPPERLWPAVAECAARFELAPLAHEGALDDGVTVTVPVPQVLQWASDDEHALQPWVTDGLIWAVETVTTAPPSALSRVGR
jgi:hypothetical protein